MNISEDELESLLCNTYKRATEELREIPVSDSYRHGQAEGKLIVCEEILVKTHGGAYLYDLYRQVSEDKK